MKYFKYGIFIPFVLFLVSCTTPPVSVETDYETKRDNDPDRVETIKRAKDRSKGPICKGDDDCEDICKDIYKSRRDKNDCEKLSVSQVEEFEILYEILEDPDFDDLEEIDSDALDVFININIQPFESLLKKYSKRDAKNVLTWIATKDGVAKLFAKEESDNYGVLSKLLKYLVVITDANPFNVFTALASDVDGNDGFMDIAIINGNEPALKWVHEYLEEESCSNDLETVACFNKYCTLADTLNDDYASDLLGFKYFEGYLNDIIEDGINGDTTVAGTGEDRTATSWDADPDSDNYIEDIDGLDDDWWEGPAAAGNGGLCSNN